MNEEEILVGIRKKDSSIYSYLINEYSKLMWYVASAVLDNVGSKEDVEDSIAETFAKLWEHPDKFDSNRGSIKTYLCLIVKSTAIDKVRKINRVRNIIISEVDNLEIDELEHDLIRKHEVKEIYDHVKDFREPDAEIFILRYFYQLKPIEISEKLCITVKEVSNRLYNSKKKLMEIMKL